MSPADGRVLTFNIERWKVRRLVIAWHWNNSAEDPNFEHQDLLCDFFHELEEALENAPAEAVS